MEYALLKIRPFVPAPASTSMAALAEQIGFRGPTQEEIAMRAYAIYLHNGCLPGHCNDNWRLAERHLIIEGQASIWARGWGREKPANHFTHSLTDSLIMPSSHAAGMP